MDDDKRILRYTLQKYRRNLDARDMALECGIHTGQYNEVLASFAKTLVQKPLEIFKNEGEKSKFVVDMEKNDHAVVPRIHALLVDFAREQGFMMLTKSKEEENTMLNAFDFRLPHEWFPLARSMNRKIIYHAGPTNSGKDVGGFV